MAGAGIVQVISSLSVSTAAHTGCRLSPEEMSYKSSSSQDLRTSAAIRSWLGERWRTPLGPYAMGESLRYRRQGSHDDRTAVVVWADLNTEQT